MLILGEGFSIYKKYNSMVNKDKFVKSTWSYVENIYQRRSDLVPSLVNTIQTYTEFEKSTLITIVDSRSKLTKIDLSDFTTEKLKEFNSSQVKLSATISNLITMIEKYPDLKSNQNLLDIQDQLKRIENQIAVERRFFNSASKDFNIYISTFPNNIIASVFGFKKKIYFEEDQNAKSDSKTNK